MSKGIREDNGKVRVDLLPVKPLYDIAKVMTFGAQKYHDRNWENGIEWSRMYGPIQRHLLKFWDGQDLDHESGLYHLAHAGFGILGLLEFYRTHPELDDRPRRPLKRIGLDIDGVLADFQSGVIRYNNKHKITGDMPKRFEDVTTYSMGIGFSAVFSLIMDDPEFWYSLKPFIDGRELMFTPAAYVTARPVSSDVSRQWLTENHFPMQRSISVVTTANASEKPKILEDLGIDIYVEDSVTNFMEINNHGKTVCYLMDRPWNKHIDAGHLRIYHVNQVLGGKLE